MAGRNAEIYPIACDQLRRQIPPFRPPLITVQHIHRISMSTNVHLGCYTWKHPLAILPISRFFRYISLFFFVSFYFLLFFRQYNRRRVYVWQMRANKRQHIAERETPGANPQFARILWHVRTLAAVTDSPRRSTPLGSFCRQGNKRKKEKEREKKFPDFNNVRNNGLSSVLGHHKIYFFKRERNICM